MTRLVPLNGIVPQTVIALAAAAALSLAAPELAAGQGHARPRDGGAADGGGSQSGGSSTRSGGGQSGSGSAESGRAVPRRGATESTASNGNDQTEADNGSSRSDGSPRARRTSDAGSGSPAAFVPDYSRPREGRTPTGQVAERGRAGGGTTVIVDHGGYYGGFYPWGYGGLGFGGYYAGYIDPWWYDPGALAYAYGDDYNGALRLKVKPRDAAVYVDGYFAGTVDDFDGVFQRLRIEPGPHRIEIRLDGYEPLSFEVRIQPDRTVTYTGELKHLR